MTDLEQKAREFLGYPKGLVFTAEEAGRRRAKIDSLTALLREVEEAGWLAGHERAHLKRDEEWVRAVRDVRGLCDDSRHKAACDEILRRMGVRGGDDE